MPIVSACRLASSRLVHGMPPGSRWVLTPQRFEAVQHGISMPKPCRVRSTPGQGPVGAGAPVHVVPDRTPQTPVAGLAQQTCTPAAGLQLVFPQATAPVGALGTPGDGLSLVLRRPP